MNCLNCNKSVKIINSLPKVGETELDVVFNKNANRCSWDDGLVAYVNAGYGSRNDMDKYVLAICDECIDNLTADGKMYYIDNSMGVDEKYLEHSKKVFLTKNRNNKWSV